MSSIEMQDAIEQSILNGEFHDAKIAIQYYKENYGVDDKVLEREAILNIYIEDLDRAMECVREGLNYNIFNPDLYCTMGNIYELEGMYNRAFICYEHALLLSNSPENKKIVGENILNLKENYEIEVRKVSIILLTYNNLDYTKICVQSIRQYNSEDSYELVVVDNNSTDETPEWLKEQSNIKYILNEDNKGFPAGCNQGIMISEKENDIFLLNNDTVIMPNSIFNLRLALYSQEDIGATGSVSNSISYYQQVTNQYESFDEYMDYALKNNIPNDESYEQRLKLVGFAMLIKRVVLDKVGLLDERFSPGNFEDDDISIRIAMEGYKLLLCRDSYIHHFGSVSFKKDAYKYIELLNCNERKFEEKWGFSSKYNLMIDYSLTQFITTKEEEILEVFCRAGSNLSSLSSIYKKINFYGYEVHENLKEIASNSINFLPNLDDENLRNTFDKVIISNYHEVLKDFSILTSIFHLLKNKNEKVILVINNFDYGKDNITTEDINVAKRIFLNRNFRNIDEFKFVDEEKNLVKVYLVFIKYHIEDIIYNAEYFLKEGEVGQAAANIKRLGYFLGDDKTKSKVESLKNQLAIYDELIMLIRRIEYKVDNKDSNDRIIRIIEENNLLEDSIINIIDNSIFNKVYVSNSLVSILFSNERYDYIIPLLQEAYSIDENNDDTLYNLAYVLNAFGEKDIARDYAIKIKKKSDEILNLLVDINGGK